MDPSEPIAERIRARATCLDRFAAAIASCHVTVEVPHEHQRKGRSYRVLVDVRLPGSEIVAGRHHPKDPAHQDLNVAVRDAFDAAVRQLEDYVRERRHDVKTHEPPAAHGKVKKLFRDDGYGFVELSDGTDVYFHEHSVVDIAFANLQVGDAVHVVVAESESDKGPQASTVRPMGKHHPS
jgi:cold shock CspA family protein